MQSCHINEWEHCVPVENTLFPATVCGYVHTFHICSPFQLKQWAKSGCIFIQMILWMSHFYCLFFQTSLDFSQVLLRNPAVAIDWMLSLKRPFASAYLVSFVLFGTSSSPTRQWQLSWEWRGPLGMPGLRLPRPLSQHVFVTGMPRKHKLTVIWSGLGKRLNMALHRLLRCHPLTAIIDMLDFYLISKGWSALFGYYIRGLVATMPL